MKETKSDLSFTFNLKKVRVGGGEQLPGLLGRREDDRRMRERERGRGINRALVMNAALGDGTFVLFILSGRVISGSLAPPPPPLR